MPSARTLVLPLLLALAGCSSTEEASPMPPAKRPEAKAIAQNYAANVQRNYEECLDKARALEAAVDAFVKAPTEATHAAAKSAWIAARIPYGPSEAYRFYGGPIDDETNGPEGFINAWPLDENFIDYTRDEPQAGLINRPDLVPQITRDALRGENENGGEKNIATGFHAIEFLLWGQDSVDPNDGKAGQRPYTDYVVGAGNTAANPERRGAYLLTVARMLVEDLESLVAAWDPNRESYGKRFADDSAGALTQMLTGIGSLSNAELAGERMTVAYKNRSQEDEHSCFSDSTAADLLGNALGIENVYLGRYGNADGPGVDELVAEVDPALDTQMKRELGEMMSAFTALQSTPFDKALAAPDSSPDRTAIVTAIGAAKKVSDTIVRVGQVLGVTFVLEEPSETL